MTSSNAAVPDLADAFTSNFAMIQPLIANEWPAVDADVLAKTRGELDRVVELVARCAGQSEPLVRGRLEALLAVASRPANTNDAASANPTPKDPLVELLERLEKKTTELAAELRRSVLPDAREKVKENLLVSLLVALGRGFILGVIFAMGGRSRGR